MKRRRIALIGAGPAGLTAALAGCRLGLDVRLYERSVEFRPVGGGLMLHGNGLRVLESLDALEPFRPALHFTARAHLLATGGRVLSTSDLDELDPPRNRAAVVLRHQLQEHLLAQAESAGAHVAFGRRLVGITTVGREAILRFEDGDEETADGVIAADGVHSAARDALGLKARKIAVGEAYLRAVSDVPSSVPDLREIWGDDGRRFGIAPLPDRKTYLFCSAPLGGWETVRREGLSDWLATWDVFGAEVRTLLRGVPDWSKVNYAELHEVRMPRWHRPPIFLVGDAAHAMTPNLGQGANSAMVDAMVLMRLLAAPGGDDLAAVARRHEAIRLRFVTRVQSTARQVGIMAALRWAPARRARNVMLGLTSRLTPIRHSYLKTLIGFNPAEAPYLGPIPAVQVSR